MFDWSKVSTLTSQITLINRHKVFGMGGTMGRNVNALGDGGQYSVLKART